MLLDEVELVPAEAFEAGVVAFAAGVVVLATGVVVFEELDLVALIDLDAFEAEVLFDEAEVLAEGEDVFVADGEDVFVALDELLEGAVVFADSDSELLLVIVVEASGSVVSLKTLAIFIVVPKTLIS